MAKISNDSLITRAYEILNEIKAGKTTDDERIDIRMIIRCIKTVYPSVLQAYIDEKVRLDEEIDPSIYVTVPVCLKQESYNSVKKVIVKKAYVPKAMSGPNGMMVKSFYTDEHGIELSKSNSYSIAELKTKNGLYSKAKASFYFEGGQVKVVLPNAFSFIDKGYLSYVPENPMETLSGNCYDIWSTSFPIKGFLWARTKEYILKMDAVVMMNGLASVDTTNDSTFSNETIKKLQWALQNR